MKTGSDLVNLARGHLGEEYVLGTLVPKNDPSWKGPWDCAEFVSWCVYQLIGKLFGCADNNGDPATADAYTGFWGRDVTPANRVSLGIAACTAGAVVLRLGPKMGHIVISDGQGGTIEAAGAAYGVIHGWLANRRWDTGILVPGIEYTTGYPLPTPEPDTTIYRLTSPYMRGPIVNKIQVALQSRGYYLSVPDGIFGPLTLSAVINFQRDRGLVVDGEVGLQTLAALGIR
jgi:N-acetylmuramoyl-L-alanine amidase